MGKDILPILEGWDYIPNEITVRIIKGDDGKNKIQLRLDLGLLQMEMDGRPDGKRPFGQKSLLEYYENLIDQHEKKYNGSMPFFLDTRDCIRLQNEAIQYYHRYLSCMKLGDYVRVARDTARNLRVFDLVKKYAADDGDRLAFEQYRPYLLMMFTRARCTLNLEIKDYDEAIKCIEEGIQKIRAFYEEFDKVEEMESSFELNFLENWAKEITKLKPISYPEKLKQELDQAVQMENYERAAQIRDQIKDLTGKNDNYLK